MFIDQHKGHAGYFASQLVRCIIFALMYFLIPLTFFYLFVVVSLFLIFYLQFDTTWLHLAWMYRRPTADRVSRMSGKFARVQLFFRGPACLRSIIASPWQRWRSRWPKEGERSRAGTWGSRVTCGWVCGLVSISRESHCVLRIKPVRLSSGCVVLRLVLEGLGAYADIHGDMSTH